MQQAIVVELSGALLSDAKRWARWCAGSVRRAFRRDGSGDAAARAAVVCVPCDLFYSGGNGQQLATLADCAAATRRSLA